MTAPRQSAYTEPSAPRPRADCRTLPAQRSRLPWAWVEQTASGARPTAGSDVQYGASAGLGQQRRRDVPPAAAPA